MSTQTEISTAELMDRYVQPNYGRFPIGFERGQGVRVEDESGRSYMDFGTGIAVCSLGHSHPVMLRAIQRQSGKLIHTSNLYWIREQALLAQKLVDDVVGIPGRVFFCNSGAEADETLIKLARKFGNDRPNADGKPRIKIISFDGSFHGRTLGGLSATGNPKVHAGFTPLPEGFVHVPFNDLEAVRQAVDDETGAILVEAVQGEGGILAATPQFLRGIDEICQQNNLLLMFDEVQCGIGRLGNLAGWKSIVGESGVTPHAVSWAKGLGGGVPIGATWITETDDIYQILGPGTHGCTFGGNFLSSAVANAVLAEIQDKELCANARDLGEHIVKTIEAWNSPLIDDVRGMGLMLGIIVNDEKVKALADCDEGTAPAIYFVKKLMEAGLLTVPAQTNVVRLLPPLNITKAEADEALGILNTIMSP